MWSHALLFNILIRLTIALFIRGEKISFQSIYSVEVFDFILFNILILTFYSFDMAKSLSCFANEAPPEAEFGSKPLADELQSAPADVGSQVSQHPGCVPAFAMPLHVWFPSRHPFQSSIDEQKIPIHIYKLMLCWL